MDNKIQEHNGQSRYVEDMDNQPCDQAVLDTVTRKMIAYRHQRLSALHTMLKEAERRLGGMRTTHCAEKVVLSQVYE